ncbi:hypothetical protein HPB50_016435 [Hyalomma asiaticum]|uniref:Uncharacterized protein n=1 Tax=Hyalomma asiaticum TaxID=266040 RepID=A0ACB7RL96_HYAAI|nr:hypothetical protein HPB50_016435 [Hyalomma asiaticum]
MAAQDSVNTAAMHENTPPAPMDEEPSQGNEDGTWFLVARKRKKQAQAESNLPHNIEPTHQGQTQPMFRKKSSLLPPLPIGDLKVVFRPRDGLNLGRLDEDIAASKSGVLKHWHDDNVAAGALRSGRRNLEGGSGAWMGSTGAQQQGCEQKNRMKGRAATASGLSRGWGCGRGGGRGTRRHGCLTGEPSGGQRIVRTEPFVHRPGHLSLATTSV